MNKNNHFGFYALFKFFKKIGNQKKTEFFSKKWQFFEKKLFCDQKTILEAPNW